MGVSIDYEVYDKDRLLLIAYTDGTIYFANGYGNQSIKDTNKFLKDRTFLILTDGKDEDSLLDMALVKELVDSKSREIIGMLNGVYTYDTIWVKLEESFTSSYAEALECTCYRNKQPLHLFRTKTYDISNGPGVRLSLFFTGCEIHCPGCFNGELQDRNAGYEFNALEKLKVLQELCKYAYSGMSILGGEPMESYNYLEVCAFIEDIKSIFGDKRSIWVYTGYTWETIEKRCKYLKGCDVLVDGPFIESKKSIELVFRGSSNQRFIDVPTTLKSGSVVLKEGLGF